MTGALRAEGLKRPVDEHPWCKDLLGEAGDAWHFRF
jgi:hypothetical protein